MKELSDICEKWGQAKCSEKSRIGRKKDPERRL